MADGAGIRPILSGRGRIAAVAALDLHEGAGESGGFALWDPLGWDVGLTHAGEDIAARVVVGAPHRFVVHLGDGAHRVERRGGAWWVDDAKMQARISRQRGEVTVFWDNGYRFAVADPLDRAAGAAGGGNLIEAPMPGLVKSVHARAGQAVAAGDRLAVLEAMKMEHSLLAARDGIVAEVLVEAGAQVESGAALVRLEDPEG